MAASQKRPERATSEELYLFETHMKDVFSLKEWKFVEPAKIKLKLPKRKRHIRSALNEIRREIVGVVEHFHAEGNAIGQCYMYQPKNVLKQFSYQLAVGCQEKALESELREFWDDYLRSLGKHVQRNPKQKGASRLHYLCLLGLDPNGSWTGSGEVSRLARQLHYAQTQGVPSKFLVGFTYQTGGQVVSLERVKEEDERRSAERKKRKRKEAKRKAKAEKAKIREANKDEWG